MSKWISGHAAQVALEKDSNEAQKHANIYHFALGAVIFFLFLVKICMMAEMKWWHRKSRKAGQVDLGYDLGPDAEDQHLKRVVMPLWQRVLRSWLAFIRKVRLDLRYRIGSKLTLRMQYFMEINVPWLNITLAELGIVFAYLGFLLWCLLDEGEVSS